MEKYIDTASAYLSVAAAQTFTDKLHGKNKKLVAGNGAWTGSMYWGDNASEVNLFDAYPAGARQINKIVPGNAQDYGYILATFWTKTAINGKYYCRAIDPLTENHTDYGDGTRIIREDANKILGFSVRCIKANN